MVQSPDIPNSVQSPDIGQNSDEGISDFWISGHPFINKNCHNSKTSHNIDMKLALVTKIYKINTTTTKKIDDDAFSGNGDAIVYIPVYV